MTVFILPQRDENEKIESGEKKTIFTKFTNIGILTFSYFLECVMVKEIKEGVLSVLRQNPKGKGRCRYGEGYRL